METININSSTYVDHQSTQKQFNKNQISLLTKSMLISGIGFIIICLLSELFAWAFSFANVQNQFGLVMGLIFGFLIVSMAISALWAKILWKGKAPGLTFLVYSIYILTMSISFGAAFNFLWFGLGEDSYPFLCICFAVTGLIFLLIALIAKVISLKGIITYAKIVGVASVIMMALFFAFLITMLVFAFTANPGKGFDLTADAITWMALAFMTLVTFFYIILDIRAIMGLSEFYNYTGSETTAPAVVWYTGFRLLTDLVNVLILVILFALRFIRR